MGTFRDIPYILVFLIFLNRASARKTIVQVIDKDNANASYPLSDTLEFYPANGYENDTDYLFGLFGKTNPMSIINVTLLDVDINEDSLTIFADTYASEPLSPTFNGTDGICTTASNPYFILIRLQTNFNPGRGFRLDYTMELEGGPYLPADTVDCTVPTTYQETTPNQPTTPQESSPNQSTTPQESTNQPTTPQEATPNQPTTPQETIPNQPTTPQETTPNQPTTPQESSPNQSTTPQESTNQPTTPPTGSTIIPDNGKCNLKYMLERREFFRNV